MFRNKTGVSRWWVVSPPDQASSWSTTPCRLSVTAYSIHSQLPSISAGRLLHPQPEETDVAVIRRGAAKGLIGPTYTKFAYSSVHRISEIGIHGYLGYLGREAWLHDG
jgi:hypothetical protein